MTKLYVASETERRAVLWARASYPRWRVRFTESISDGEREMRRLYPYAGYWRHVARPFGFQEWNVYTQAVRHCLRRNRYFQTIAKRMAIDSV